MSVGERIKMRRKQIGLSAEQVAERLGVSPATVYRYESNDIMNMRIDKLEPIAAALNTTPAFLMGWDESTTDTSNLVSVRFCGPVAAHFSATPTALTEYMEVPRDWLGHRPESDFFLAVVDGHSMYPHYQDGDYILCLRCSDMGRSGRDGIIAYGNDETTFKRIEYVQGKDWIDLVPYNPEYKTNRIEGADLESCRVIGRVVRLIRKVDDV